MSKKAVLFFLFFSLLFSSYSQILEPISWEFKVDSSNYSDSKKLDLIFEPTTEVGWYIYPRIMIQRQDLTQCLILMKMLLIA